MALEGIPVVPTTWADQVEHRRRLATSVNQIIEAAGDGTLTGNGAFWEKLDETDASSDPSIDFFWDDTLYDEIRVSFYNCLPATNAVNLYLRVSTDGSTFLSTSTYHWTSNQQSSGPVTLYADTRQGSAGTATEIQGTLNALSSTANEVSAGEIIIRGPGETGIKSIETRVVSSSVLSDARYFSGAGLNTATGALKGLQLFVSSGNISQGTFVLWGLRKDGGVFTPAFTGQTTNTTPTVIHSIAVAAESAIALDFMVQGREASGGACFAQRLFAIVRNEGGTTSISTVTKAPATAASIGTVTGWACTLQANDTTDEAELLVTGPAGTVDWAGNIESIVLTD